MPESLRIVEQYRASVARKLGFQRLGWSVASRLAPAA
jgi:hypothetical protein